MNTISPIIQNHNGQIQCGNTDERMSHIEIAKIAGKRTDSVKSTIERLVKEGVMHAPQIEGRRNEVFSGAASTNIHILLNRLDSITVMATIDGKQCTALVKRWDELESGKAQPIANQMQSQPQPPANQYSLLTRNLKASQECKTFAESWGFEGNQALLTADRLVKAQTGFSPLEAMGQKALIAPVQEMTYTPTELGKFYTPSYSPVTMNQVLQQAGMQELINDRWTPTERVSHSARFWTLARRTVTGRPLSR